LAYTPCGLQIPGPIITPDRYGLLTVAEPMTPEDGHWEGGVTWDDNLCSDIHSTVGFCPIPVTGSVPKIADRDFQSCCAEPFIVYGSYDCPPVGNTAGEAFTIAEKRLIIREGREVERVFWTGITEGGDEVNPSLAFGNDTCGDGPIDLTPTGGPVGPVASLAILESALGVCAPGAGVIHANYGLASFLAANYLIYSCGDAWFTVTGQRLAIGAGYPGTGPGNIPATSGATWVFATGPIVIMRSEIFLTPERFLDAFNHTLNNVSVYAERVYSVGWSCCLFGIQVLLCP
jgi:hypothetical protein